MTHVEIIHPFSRTKGSETPFIIHIDRTARVIAWSRIDSNVNALRSPEFSVSHKCGTQPYQPRVFQIMVLVIYNSRPKLYTL